MVFHWLRSKWRNHTHKPESFPTDDAVHHNVHEKQDNHNFRQYVEDKKDLEGMIAYCFYKFQKIEAFDAKPNMTPEEKAEICRTLIEGKTFWENKESARIIMDNLSEGIIRNYIIAKTWKKDFVIAIIAGILSGVFAPLTWDYIDKGIKKSHVTDSLIHEAPKEQPAPQLLPQSSPPQKP